MSTERLGRALPQRNRGSQANGGQVAPEVVEVAPEDAEGAPGMVEDSHADVAEFVRFCYRRRSVAWPELYDEMCAVAARGDYRGMGYEQLESLGIRLALAWLPRMAAMSARVIAEERGGRAASAAAS